MSLVSSGDKLPRCVPHPHFQGNQRDKNTSIFLTLAAEEHRPGRLDSPRLYTLFKFSLFCLYQERQIYMNSIRTCSASLKKLLLNRSMEETGGFAHTPNKSWSSWISIVNFPPPCTDHGRSWRTEGCDFTPSMWLIHYMNTEPPTQNY